MAKNMIGLPPGTTTTFWPATRIPRDFEMYSAMASRKSGVGIDDFVAGLERRQHGEEHDWLAAGNDDDSLGADADVPRA